LSYTSLAKTEETVVIIQAISSITTLQNKHATKDQGFLFSQMVLISAHLSGKSELP